MKNAMIPLVLAMLAFACHAQSEQIKITTLLQEGDDVLAAPSVTVMPGKEAKIAVAQEFVDPGAHLSSHPVGVTMDSFTEIEKGKVAYSIALTIRELVEGNADSIEKSISTFKTRELLLSGVTPPDEHVKAKIDSETTLTLSFEIMPSEG